MNSVNHIFHAIAGINLFRIFHADAIVGNGKVNVVADQFPFQLNESLSNFGLQSVVHGIFHKRLENEFDNREI